MSTQRREWMRRAGTLLLVLAACSTAAPTVAEAARRKPRAVQRDDAPDLVTYGHREDVMRFAADLAQRRELDPAWVAAQLERARFVPSVARLIMPPPAGTAKNWAAYRARFVEPQRIAAGLRFWQANQRWLERAEAQYGVPASVIVGIVGVETFYGRITGTYRVLDALATLSFDFPTGRSDRSAFFRDELEQFLLMCRREGTDCASFKGSYAGAMGLPQFMPSSINRHAVDYDGDGHINLLDSPADVIGSVAHFLAEAGWQRGLPTRFDVAAPVDVRERAALLAPDIVPSFTPQQFAEHGAVLLSPGARDYPGPLALVELQNGDAAPSYVAGTQNFFALTRYNWSSYYAMAVLELGEAVAREAAAAPPPALQLVSWNMEWLAEADALQAAGYWERCPALPGSAKLRPELPVCDAYAATGLRSAADYAGTKLAAARDTLARLAAEGLDVLAVQEVQSPAALQAVLPPGYRVACFTTRTDAQNIGFALRDAAGLQAQCREVPALSLEDQPEAGHKVRRGLELTLTQGTHRVTLLNVHLKSGCAHGRMDNESNAHCALLQRQAAPLEQWMEAQAAPGSAFAIVGDWNRDLEAEIRGDFPARTDGSDPKSALPSPALVRNLWPEVNDLSPPASAMELAEVDRSAAADRACHETLDQLAVGVLLRAQLAPGSLSPAGRLPARLLPRPAAASDHCPLQARLQWR